VSRGKEGRKEEREGGREDGREKEKKERKERRKKGRTMEERTLSACSITVIGMMEKLDRLK
jgi:hypothetical protein